MMNKKLKNVLQLSSLILGMAYMLSVFASCTVVISIATDSRYLDNAQASGNYSVYEFWLPVVSVYTFVGFVVLAYLEP